MSSKSSDKHYTVYKHTAPNNKVYIGITGFDPKYRWLNNGKGYKTQTVFFNAIIKYGWINFKHEILFKGLTEKEALDKEEELIQQYKSYDRRYGYNISLRGAIYGESKNKKGVIGNSVKAPKQIHSGIEVIRKDKNGNTLEAYSSVNAAARSIGMHCETFRNTLNKKGKIIYNDTFFEYGLRKKIPKLQMLTLNNEYIRHFDTLGDAYKYLGKKNKGKITKVCEGKLSSYQGYKWRFDYENTNYESA